MYIYVTFNYFHNKVSPKYSSSTSTYDRLLLLYGTRTVAVESVRFKFKTNSPGERPI